MKKRNGIGQALAETPSRFLRFLGRQPKRLVTISFWKRVLAVTFVAMATVGSYVTLKSMEWTRGAVETVEAPFVRAWQGFNGDNIDCRPVKKSTIVSKSNKSYVGSKKIAAKKATPKKIVKKSYSSKKSSSSNKSYAKKSSSSYKKSSSKKGKSSSYARR